MMKNLLVLCIFTWVATAAAAPLIAQESMKEAESFKVEKATKEETQGRALAGSPIKKKAPEAHKDAPSTHSSEPDSEVQYWQYSE